MVERDARACGRGGGEESACVGVDEDLGVAPRGRWKNDGKKNGGAIEPWLPGFLACKRVMEGRHTDHEPLDLVE
jgi:hypothetical protein